MREVFVHGTVPTKTSFSFQKFISICSEGAPKDNDKNRENNIWRISGKMASKVSLILSNHDTCVKYERFFCAWDFFQQKPLSFFTNSPPVVHKECWKTMTKTGKNIEHFEKIWEAPFNVFFCNF
jgi:hypothetical protein